MSFLLQKGTLCPKIVPDADPPEPETALESKQMQDQQARLSKRSRQPDDSEAGKEEEASCFG